MVHNLELRSLVSPLSRRYCYKAKILSVKMYPYTVYIQLLSHTSPIKTTHDQPPRFKTWQE